jgi:hypothetical protein
LLSTGSILATNVVMTGGGAVGQSYTGIPESTTHMSSDSMHQPSESMHDSLKEEKEALFLEALVRKQKLDTQEKITLKETQTYFLIDLKSTCVSTEDSQYELVKQNNEKYTEVSKSRVENLFNKKNQIVHLLIISHLNPVRIFVNEFLI